MLLGVQYAALQLYGAEKSVSVVKDWIYYPDGLEKFAPGCQGVERRTEKQRESVRCRPCGCVRLGYGRRERRREPVLNVLAGPCHPSAGVLLFVQARDVGEYVLLVWLQ